MTSIKNVTRISIKTRTNDQRALTNSNPSLPPTTPTERDKWKLQYKYYQHCGSTTRLITSLARPRSNWVSSAARPTAIKTQSKRARLTRGNASSAYLINISTPVSSRLRFTPFQLFFNLNTCMAVRGRRGSNAAGGEGDISSSAIMPCACQLKDDFTSRLPPATGLLVDSQVQPPLARADTERERFVPLYRGV